MVQHSSFDVVLRAFLFESLLPLKTSVFLSVDDLLQVVDFFVELLLRQLELALDALLLGIKLLILTHEVEHSLVHLLQLTLQITHLVRLGLSIILQFLPSSNLFEVFDFDVVALLVRIVQLISGVLQVSLGCIEHLLDLCSVDREAVISDIELIEIALKLIEGLFLLENTLLTLSFGLIVTNHVSSEIVVVAGCLAELTHQLVAFVLVRLLELPRLSQLASEMLLITS